MREQGGRGDYQPHQRGGVFGEHRSNRGVRRRHDLLQEIPIQEIGPALRLRCRAQERHALEDEGDPEHDVRHGEVVRRLGMQQLLDPVRDRHRCPGHEDAHAGQQRPDVRLAPMTERVRGVGGRPALRLAMTRNTSLPVSAHEWAASASIDADAVRTAATDFASAMRRLAANATTTVVTLSAGSIRSSWPNEPKRPAAPTAGVPEPSAVPGAPSMPSSRPGGRLTILRPDRAHAGARPRRIRPDGGRHSK
jgi:hypothetical protein